ncbi:GntR family transcriptional regulator [bacterium]|nr:MAG: GntR family transcriptional regulator [bacterium]
MTRLRTTNSRRALLALRILKHLQGGRFAIGSHLTETALAEAFGVSRSPIRSALSLLAEKQVLRNEPHRGYFLARPPSELSDLELHVEPSDHEALFRRIARDRFNGRLSERFTEATLIRRYRKNRAQVTKVLDRLAQEGLAQRSHGRGWVFSPVLDSERAHADSYRFRLLLEPQALRLDTFEADREMLRRSRAEHEQLLRVEDPESDRAPLFRIDSEFHELVASFSHNAFILQAIQQQNRLRRLAEYEGYSNRRRLRTWCHEHIAIIEAILVGDQELAADLMRQHLTNAQKNAFFPANARKAVSRRPAMTK